MQDRAEHLAIEQPAPSISQACGAKKLPSSVPGGTA
jgi:hypothetical protein